MNKKITFKKRMLSALLCLLMIVTVIPITTISATASAPNTIQAKSLGDQLNYFYYNTGARTVFDKKVALVDGAEQYVYCLNRDLPFDYSSYTTYTKGGSTTAAIDFILANGLLKPNGGYANPDTKSKYMTGNEDKDYYITAAAVHVFDEGSNINPDVVMCDDSAMLSKFKALVNDTRAKSRSSRFSRATVASISATPTNQDFTLKGDYFETDWYNVSFSSDLIEYVTDFSSATPSTVKIINASGNEASKLKPSDNKFKFRIAKKDVTSNMEIKFRLRGSFSSSSSVRYTAPVSGRQPIATLIPIEAQENSREIITAKLNAVGDIKLKKTSDYGSVSDIGFKVTGANNFNQTVYTNKDGSIDMKDLLIGNYTFEEIVPDMYLPQDPQTVTVNAGETATINFNNIVKKGKINILKHNDDGSTAIETPEVGAVFEVYRKEKDSYENSTDVEKDILTTDNDGYAETKALPYGEYTVKQTVAKEGLELMKPFTVNITEHDKTYRYIINNATFEALIKIVKKDIETDKQIPYAGIGFKVKNTDTGEYVVQHINYPTPIDIDTFYTDDEGQLMLPGPLAYGNYQIEEVQTAHGYVLSEEPVPFKVDGTEETVTVEKHNIAQKGEITIYKQGEVFTAVTTDDKYQTPVFENAFLEGAEYEVYAEEDIVTLEGTVRANKGDLVGLGVTGTDGKVAIDGLYLGKYKLIETKAPHGMTINNEPYYFELEYQGQEINVIRIDTTFTNERQRVAIELNKILEQDDLFKIGNNGEIINIRFGLYTNEDITSAEGTVIEKDSLLDEVQVNENGIATFNTDIPFSKYYVKEIATDEHYILSDEKFEFEFKYTNQDEEIQKIVLNEGLSIENILKRGSIKGLKTDEEGNVLAGAKIGLFTPEESEFTEENALMIDITEEDGVFSFENLPLGNVIVKEIEAPEGYKLSDEIFNLEIIEDGQVIEIVIINELSDGSLKINKVSKDGNISGFSFKVSGTSYKGEKYEEVFTTDDKGVINIEKLAAGEYIVSEVENDKTVGYITPDDKEIEIKPNELTEIEMRNIKIPVKETPKTGENIAGLILFSFLGLSSFAFVLTIILKGKTKK